MSRQDIKNHIVKFLSVDDVANVVIDYLNPCMICYTNRNVITTCYHDHIEIADDSIIVKSAFRHQSIFTILRTILLLSSLIMVFIIVIYGRTCNLNYNAYVLQNNNTHIGNNYNISSFTNDFNYTTYDECNPNVSLCLNLTTNNTYETCVNLLSVSSIYYEPFLCINDTSCWNYTYCDHDYDAKYNSTLCHRFDSFPNVDCFYLGQGKPYGYCNAQATRKDKPCLIYNATLNLPNYQLQNYIYRNDVTYNGNIFSSVIYTCFEACNLTHPLTGSLVYVYDTNRATLNLDDIPCDVRDNQVMLAVGIIYVLLVILIIALFTTYQFYLYKFIRNDEIGLQVYFQFMFTAIAFGVLFAIAYGVKLHQLDHRKFPM